MKFITLTPEEFTKFANKSPYKSFMQTTEIATLREQDGWTAYYLGVEDEGKTKAATMLVAKPTFLGKSMFITPGGPLLDLTDTKLTNYFFRNLKKYIKNHNGYVLHIDPYFELIERDREGEIKPGGFHHQKALTNLKNLGFKTTTSTQPKYLFALDLKGQTPDQLLADFKRNTRNHVRKAERQGVEVRELKREELGVFKQITESTSKRRNFSDRTQNYYQQMYDLFHEKDEVKFMLAEVTVEKKTIPLSAAMFMLYGDEVVYLFSGSDEKYMKEYNAQYLIQWRMIKYASEKGFKTYNFYGINGLPDRSNKDYGIFGFKKGFTSDKNGRVIELIGSYELPINASFYHLHEFLTKAKRKVKKPR